jgi:transposase-like protein
MTHLSKEAKQTIIKKALNSHGQTVANIAHANNIGASTLSRWLRPFKSKDKAVIHRKTTLDTPITLEDRFTHLQATLGQDDGTIGAYCRKHGLYPHQLTQWKADFMSPKTPQKSNQPNAELKELRAEIKELKHILARKDKVLAETVALLVLKKKADQIWGDHEED